MLIVYQILREIYVDGTKTKKDTSEEPISDDLFIHTHLQINKPCTLCAEVSKAVILNCLLAANINIEGISSV